MNKVDSEDYRHRVTPPEVKPSIKSLPLEIFEMILLNLNEKDMESAAKICSYWNITTICTAKRKEFLIIKDFAKFLGENLNNKYYSIQIENLFNIGSDKTILNSVNLMEVKSSVFGLRENILNIMKNVKEDDLKKLEELSKGKIKSKFFENVFDIARIYSQIEVAKSAIDEWTKKNLFQYNSSELTKIGCFDKALEIANMILDDDTRGDTLRVISEELAKRGNIDKAIEVAKKIPDDEIRGYTLNDISAI